MRERGLVIEEATLAPDAEHIVSIPIQNFSCEPLFLKPGEVLGQVQPVTLLSDPTPLVEESIEFEKIISIKNDVSNKNKNDGGSIVGSECRCAGDVVVATIKKSSCKDTNGDDVSRETRLLKSVHVDDNPRGPTLVEISYTLGEISRNLC